MLQQNTPQKDLSLIGIMNYAYYDKIKTKHDIKTNDEQFYPHLLTIPTELICSICKMRVTNYIILNKQVVCDDCYKDDKLPIEATTELFKNELGEL